MNGSLLEYSSIDVHNDYMIQEFVDPNVMGIGKPNLVNLVNDPQSLTVGSWVVKKP